MAWFTAVSVMAAMPGANARLADPFDLADVRLLDGPFKEAQERDKGYILRVEPERLMHWLRVNNGVSSKAKPYGEWKTNDYAFQGHYEGHFLSACAEMYRSTGDLRFKDRLDQTVAIMAEVQTAKGSGWLAPFPESWVRIMAGIEARPAGLGRLPVPWYALHKVYQGLIDAHTLAGNQQALDVMLKVAAWLEKYSAQINDEAFQKMLDEEHGGINEAIANLYAITKNPAHLALAKRFCHRKVMEPLALNQDILDGLHANTQVPKFTGFARLYEFTSEPQYHDAASNFWRYVVAGRSYANGGNSNHEKFTPKQHLSLSLSKGNTETCNTHNMLKLTRHLFMWAPSAGTADYYERAQLNHILSSQHPQHGTVAYFHSLESGNRKGFSPSWVTFACCHGSGMENHAKYGDSIYFHRGGERLFINLFIASELNWKDVSLTLRQTTMFPEEAGTTLEIVASQPVKTTLSIRKPLWVGPGFAVTVNGEAIHTTTGAEGYVDIERIWKTGDRIAVKLPMSLRWEGFEDNPDRAALLYGPAMLVAKTDGGARYSVVRKPADKALTAVKATGKPLHFTGDPTVFQRDLTAKPISFLPMYQECSDPYIAYWDLRDEVRMAADRATYETEAKRWTQLAPRTVDMVFFDAGTPSATSTMPGRLASDPALPRTAGANRSEKDHDLEAHNGYNHEFNEPQRIIAGHWQTFRTAELGSDRFGWTLALERGKPQLLLIRLWSPPADDPDARRATNCGLEVQVAGVKAMPNSKDAGKDETTTQGNQLDTGAKAKAIPALTKLGTIGPAKADGTFRDVTFPIPAALAAGNDLLIVRIVRQGGKVGGLVAEARVMKDTAEAAAVSWADNPVGSPLEPVRLKQVRLGGFWKQQVKLQTEKWLPHCVTQMEKGGRGQELLNLVATGKVLRGATNDWKFTGAIWSDAYVYNVMESICLALAFDPQGDPDFTAAQLGLRAKMEEWIPVILAAQDKDGYIHSYHVLRNHQRFTKDGDHEFYVMGYFLEMGVAHYRLTDGKDRRLFDAAIRCANFLNATFGPTPKRSWRNGHPGLEYALCRLGVLVNEVQGGGKGDPYIQLARHFLDHQHVNPAPNVYNQSEQPPVEMTEARGHAVRATYFYTAMTDIALLQNNALYHKAVGRLWGNAIQRKSYLTGGVGASAKGEAFAGDYELPNNGYCESCAACGMSFWADRMHALHTDAHFRDVQERLLYNAILGSVELTGTNFYYQNPLESNKSRYPWHSCPCCVGNIPRTLFGLTDAMYSTDKTHRELFISHFVDSEATIPDMAGAPLRIRQETEYPWQGRVGVTLHPTRAADFTVKLRIPDRTDSDLYHAVPDVAGVFKLSVNGEVQKVKAAKGYVALTRRWKSGDNIKLELPMPVQRVYCDEKVAANRGRVALQRGPVVYSVEDLDHPQPVKSLVLKPEMPLEAAWKEKLLGGVMVIEGPGVMAVPNYVRLNRGGWSQVWLTEDPAAVARNLPKPPEMVSGFAEIQKRTVDYVKIGDADLEKQHALQGDKIAHGEAFSHEWRHAAGGGWFSYQMKVAPEGQQSVYCIYWGSDRGNRIFDILVNGEKIATQKLESNKPNEFFAVEYSIPANLTAGKQQVTVKFQAHPGSTAGGVFDCRVVKGK